MVMRGLLMLIIIVHGGHTRRGLVGALTRTVGVVVGVLASIENDVAVLACGETRTVGLRAVQLGHDIPLRG